MVQGTALSASLVEVVTVPETPVIELTRAGQALNFDFRVRDGGESPILLSQLTLVVHGREGQPTFNEIARDPAALMGNHVIIDNGNGEFSQLGHLMQGSVAE